MWFRNLTDTNYFFQHVCRLPLILDYPEDVWCMQVRAQAASLSMITTCRMNDDWTGDYPRKMLLWKYTDTQEKLAQHAIYVINTGRWVATILTVCNNAGHCYHFWCLLNNILYGTSVTCCHTCCVIYHAPLNNCPFTSVFLWESDYSWWPEINALLYSKCLCCTGSYTRVSHTIRAVWGGSGLEKIWKRIF